VVGDTGIEPVTPTVSKLYRSRWLRRPGLHRVESGIFLRWTCWFWWLATAPVLHGGCTWPGAPRSFA